MPATSAKQKRFMDAAAHNPAFAKKVGVPVKVAKEYSQASKGQTFKQGGEMKHTMKKATKKTQKFGIGGLPAGSPDRTVPGTQPATPTPSGSIPVSRTPATPRSIPVRQTPVTQRPPATPRFSTSTPVRRPSGPGAVRTGPNPLTVDSIPIGFGGPNTDRRSTSVNPDKLKEVQALSPMKKGGRIAAKGEHAVQKQSKRGAEMVKMARGGGIEIRGKTKGKMLARGGKTC